MIFTANNEEPKDSEQDANAEEEEEISELASALASCEEEAKKLIHFKKTKVDSVDKEFNILADLASDILKYEEQMNNSIATIKQVHGITSADILGMLLKTACACS